MELTEKDRKKIERNELENKTFEETLDKLLKNKLPTNELVRIGTTPFCLRVAGAGVMPLMMSASDLRNCIEGQKLSNHNKRNHTENHNIPIETVKKFPEALRNPVCICTGNKPNSLLVISDLMDKHNQNIVFPVYLNVRGFKKEINKIYTAFGRKNVQEYILRMEKENKILAVNKEKIEKCFVVQPNIGLQLPKSETFINLDNSIAYSTANVKYISEISQNNSEKEKFPSGDERSDNMAEISQQELLKRIAALESQVKEMSAEQQNLKEQIETVNNFVSAITESQNFEQSMSTIESMGKQVLDCGKAEFWCYDGAENKYFTNDENRGGRDWQIAKENMRIAAETKEAHIADGEAYIPIISNDKVAGILVASEKDGTFDKASLDKFSPNGQIANTIDLSLKKEFEHQGRITDELTRLKNRQGAKEYAANTMAHNVNAEKDMCLIMCDIDHFKSINDTYGHDAGDTVLKNVAGILQSGTRQGADSAFRWGGEEMVCVLNCDYDHAMDIAERLRQQIESTTHLVYNADKEPTNVSVTISMGVYQVKPDKEITQENAFSFFESQLKFADELAYKAKETGRNKVVGESDIMYEKTAEKESYSIFRVEKGDGFAFFRDNNTDINTLMQRYVDCHNDNNLINYDEFLKGCTEISEVVAAELEQMGNPPPAFCAEITIDENELRVWDDEKIATINLDEAIQSIKENGTVNLDYQKFAENNDTMELTSEYLDFSVNLDNAYDDFMYHNSIFNDEHIDFVDKHGQLPYDLSTAENRDIVTEYINIQLESGSNLSESQKETLTELKNQIDEIKEMETKLGIDEGDLKFIAETKSAVAWTNEAMKTLDERNAGRDEQGRDDPF